jgi:formate hydrogenlyase subunit 3/multisubunit Na+/H+ antiporter MnhD subunit
VNPLPGPILLFVLPLLAAGITYFVRRWAILAAFIAATTAGVLAFLCLRLPLDQSALVLGQEVAFGRPVVVMGQTLQLESAGQLWLAFIFGLAVVFYLFAWRVSQGWSFFPFSLVIMALYVLVILLQVFSLQVLVYAISVTLAVLIIQGGQLSSVRGAQRYLVVSLLAVPLLLAAAWLMDPARSTPQDAETIRRVLLPAALGFGLLLGAFPFGTWMPALAAATPPIVTAFVFTAGQAMALFLTLVFLQNNVQILSDGVAPAVMQIGGLVMAVAGGVMAAVQRDFGRLFGYAAMSDMGILLLALVAAGSQSVTLVLLHLVSRGLIITLMAAALSILRHRATTDRFDGLGGVARRLPIPTMGLVIGGLALAGFPLTAGFPTRWAVYRAMSGEEMLWTFLLLASSAGIVIGLLRGLNAMLGAEAARDDVARQPILASLLVFALAILVIILGIFPQLFLEPASRAAQAFALF